MNDLSDEACAQWMRRVNMPEFAENALITWQECRRRAEVRETQLIDELNFALSSIEERERKAFEAGLHDSLYSDKRMCMTEVEEAWCAYKEKQK